MDLTVVMLTRDRPDLLPMSLAHLESQSYPAARFEILIAALGIDATDGAAATVDVAERYASSVPVRTRWIRCDDGNPGRSRNRAVHEARGEYILFLDDDLLASPDLVEAHIAEHKRLGADLAVVGRVDHHPQVAPNALTRWYGDSAANWMPDQPLRFLDWRAFNLSYRRQTILDTGGFEEDLAFAGLEDIEFAWRAEDRGLRGAFSTRPCAFAWRPTSIESEEARLYQEGKALCRLLTRSQSDVLRHRFSRDLSPWSAIADAALDAARRFLGPLAQASSPLRQAALRRALRRGCRQAVRDSGPRR